MWHNHKLSTKTQSHHSQTIIFNFVLWKAWEHCEGQCTYSSTYSTFIWLLQIVQGIVKSQRICVLSPLLPRVCLCKCFPPDWLWIPLCKCIRMLWKKMISELQEEETVNNQGREDISLPKCKQFMWLGGQGARKVRSHIHRCVTFCPGVWSLNMIALYSL